jgi:glycosyltransferase involved in cell wall biosynthesis
VPGGGGDVARLERSVAVPPSRRWIRRDISAAFLVTRGLVRPGPRWVGWLRSCTKRNVSSWRSASSCHVTKAGTSERPSWILLQNVTNYAVLAIPHGYSEHVTKLLVVAPCDGEDVGEAWVAYQWVRRLSARHDVTLLSYYKRGRARASRQLPGTRVIEWAEPPGLGRLERINSMLKPGYVPFYVHARRWVRRAQASGERFDLAFQPVPAAMRYPSPVAGLGIPFIIGPVGGSLPSVPGFDGSEDTAPWYVGMRRFDRMRLRHDRLLRRTFESASCVLGIAPYVRDVLADINMQRFEIVGGAGIERLPAAVERGGPNGIIHLLFVGRLIRTKGARDAIRAVSLVRTLPVVLDIIGDGFDRAACEALTLDLGLTDRVRFHGKLDRDDVDAFYRAADVFVFPSYREPGGIVAFEAMGYGLPLIVSDIGGPGYIVDDTCGIRIHPESPEQYAGQIAAAISRLVTDQAQRHKLGEGARQRAADIGLWDSKIVQLEQIFAQVLGHPV